MLDCSTQAFCEEGVVEGNGLLAFIRHIVFPLRSLSETDPEFLIPRRAEDGGDVSFRSADETEAAFGRGEIHPGDLKSSVAAAINAVLHPIQQSMGTPERRDLVDRAYPPEVKKGKGMPSTGQQI